jgi:hypothetical protein
MGTETNEGYLGIRDDFPEGKATEYIAMRPDIFTQNPEFPEGRVRREIGEFGDAAYRDMKTGGIVSEETLVKEVLSEHRNFGHD